MTAERLKSGGRDAAPMCGTGGLCLVPGVKEKVPCLKPLLMAKVGLNLRF